MSKEVKSKTIGMNVKVEFFDAITERARSMQLSTGGYCKRVLQQWIDSGERLELIEEVK